MKVRFGSLISPLLGLLLLASVVACSDTTDSQPATVPPESPSGPAVEPLSAGDRMAVDAFADQRQTIDEEWDLFHQDFDEWRVELTSCDRSSVHEALQGFAAGFADVTAEADDLPRAIVTRELADLVIAAAEEEGAAFRQLRDRWQPDDTALFELVEQRRSDATQAQRDVEDRTVELREQLEAAAEPGERAALKEFSDALDAVSNDWNGLHDDFAELQPDAGTIDTATLFARLDGLVEGFEAVVEAASGLPSSGATESMVETLREAAETEMEALSTVYDELLSLLAPSGGPNPGIALPSAGELLSGLDVVIEESEALLAQVSRTTRVLVDDDPEEKLAEVEDFEDSYGSLLAAWDAFHRRYSDWRRTDGGCDRTDVLQSLDRFNLRMSDLGREVRRLPQSSYLLPMYNLLVEAMEREEGAIRALRNSWRPFTVDAFKAVDQERINANRLRRQADIGLQELNDRS